MQASILILEGSKPDGDATYYSVAHSNCTLDGAHSVLEGSKLGGEAPLYSVAHSDCTLDSAQSILEGSLLFVARGSHNAL